MTTSHGPNRKFKKVSETRRRDEDDGIKYVCLAPRINEEYNSENEAFSADFILGPCVYKRIYRNIDKLYLIL